MKQLLKVHADVDSGDKVDTSSDLNGAALSLFSLSSCAHHLSIDLLALPQMEINQ